MTDKPRFPRAVGELVAAELIAALGPACDRIIAAGSLRRGKPDIGDVEIVYVSRRDLQPDLDDIFASPRLVNLAEIRIAWLERDGVLDRRLNARGSETFTPKNKLMRHRATGLPVDLFATDAECWFNYLVCRTGPGESNIRIAAAAQRMGWQWNPYGAGFSRAGEVREMASERDVFAFVGLPYAEPEARR